MKTKEEKEIWVDSYHFPERYEVSNLGRVFNKRTKKYMRIGLDWPKKYNYLILAYNNQKKGCRLHRLVYLSFNPDTDITLDIHHIDHNVYNNKLSNLQPIDRALHSSMHARISGRKPPGFNESGEKHPSFKGPIIAINQETNKITHILYGQKDIKLNSEFGHSHVYSVALGKKLSHKGHFFKRISNELNVEIGEIFDINKECLK